jgi:glutaredoxin 2
MTWFLPGRDLMYEIEKTEVQVISVFRDFTVVHGLNWNRSSRDKLSVLVKPRKPSVFFVKEAV